MKPATLKFAPVLRFCASIVVLFSLVACVGVSESNTAQADDGSKAKPDMKASIQKDVEFKLLKVERTDQGKLVGRYVFKNQSQKAISIPWVTLKSEGVGVPNEISFEVLIDGKWKNPGYYRDAIPMQTTLEAGKALTLQVDVPSRLWEKTTPFRLHFGKYVSAPARLDEMK